MQIYADNGVLFYFVLTILQHKTKYYQICNNIGYIFPNYIFKQIYPFSYTKNKSKEFLCCFYIVKLFLYFSFFIFYPFQRLACISCYVKNFKFYSRIFLVILFHFQGEHFMTLKRATIINNLKFLTSPAERTHHEIFSVLYQEMLLMNVTKTAFRIVLL